MTDIGPMPPLSAADMDVEAADRRAQAGTASLALCLEALIAATVYVQVRLTEPDPGGGDPGPFGLFLLVLLPVLWGVCRLVARIAVVPLVGLVATFAGHGKGRHWGRWFPAAAGAVGLAAGLSCLLSGAAPATGGWAALAVAGALAGAGVPVWWTLRDERRVTAPEARDRVWLVGGVGFLAAVSTGVLLFTVGPLDAYQPPVLTPARIAGVWTDGHGGGIRLEPDGFMDAVGLHDRATHRGGRVVLGPGCTLSGTWSFDPHDPSEGQQVRTDSAGSCGSDEWSVLGTERDPQLYVFVDGDVDGTDVYTLTKRR